MRELDAAGEAEAERDSIITYAPNIDQQEKLAVDPSLLLLSFLDPDRDIGHQQRQLSTDLLNGAVVSNQTRFYLDSCTAFPQYVSSSHRVSPFFCQYHSIA